MAKSNRRRAGRRVGRTKPRPRAMGVGDRMSRRVTTVRPDVTLRDAAHLMRARNIRHLAVVDRARRLVGVVTARDLRQALFSPALLASGANLAALLDELSVADVMIRSVVTVHPRVAIREAARLMYERRIGALPVVDKGRLVGILTETDVLQAFQDMLDDGTAASSR